MLPKRKDCEPVGTPQGRDPRVQRKSRQEGIELRQLLARHGVRPDKRLGQHFLVSGSVVGKIVSRLEGCAGVLEVGPGPGVLTCPISESGAKVVAVELDQTILPVLAEYAPEAEIVQGDALVTNLKAILDRLPEPRGLVSNMPYNITGPLLEKFCEVRGLYSRAVLMMQREVAEKIVAKPGDSGRGALSVVMQALFSVSKVCNVPPGAFLPPPKVDSTVLEFIPLDVHVPGHILDLVRKSFVQPRKTILNNLGAAYGRAEADAMLDRASVDGQLRPHQLTWEQWQKIAR